MDSWSLPAQMLKGSQMRRQLLWDKKIVWFALSSERFCKIQI
jgi:hypothetical protein